MNGTETSMDAGRRDGNNDGERCIGVAYRPIRCPVCKSKAVATTSTRVPIRYHKCRRCSNNFKSFEE